LLRANAAGLLAFLNLHGLKGSREDIDEILQFLYGTLANTSPQRLMDAWSAEAIGCYDHLFIGNRLPHKFSAALAVNLRLNPQLAGTGEATSALMVPISADGDDVMSPRFALHAECGDVSEAQTAYGILIRDTRRVRQSGLLTLGYILPSGAERTAEELRLRKRTWLQSVLP
jgi:hypothetical protein